MAREKRKRPITVSEMAKMGGKARWADVPPEKRSEIARKAVQARWARMKARKPEKSDVSSR